MGKIYFFRILLGVLIISSPVVAQKKVVIVQPDAGLNIGALNNAIKTTTDPGNTIFELKRGGLYLLNGVISHTGYTLHIRAEAGTGHRPILQPAIDALGASSNHFNPGGGLILEGLYIQALDEIGAIQNRQIIVSGNANRIWIDDCYFDYSNQAFIRLTSINNKIFIKNSVLRNSLRPENPNNGRVIDTRDTPQDTLLIENCTIYNCFANLISASSGLNNYVRFNHNTVFQCALTYDMDIAQALKADITNNIFYNFGIRANAHSHHALFRADSIRTVGQYNDTHRFFNISNNNYYNQKEFGDIMDQYCPDILYRFDPADKAHKDTIRYKYSLRKHFFANKAMLDTITVSQPPTLWKFIKAKQVDTTNVFSEQLTFKNPPPLNLDYFKMYAQTGFNFGSLTPPNGYADEDKNNLGEVTTGAYDLSYRSYAKSASAATGGKPLGASKWVPYTVVSAEQIKADQVNKVKTYPNPATGMITFEISAVEPGAARIVICDLLGKQLNVTRKQLISGNNLVMVDLEGISKPGIYFYQVQIGDSAKKSILSGKLVKK